MTLSTVSCWTRTEGGSKALAYKPWRLKQSYKFFKKPFLPADTSLVAFIRGLSYNKTICIKKYRFCFLFFLALNNLAQFAEETVNDDVILFGIA